MTYTLYIISKMISSYYAEETPVPARGECEVNLAVNVVNETTVSNTGPDTSQSRKPGAPWASN